MDAVSQAQVLDASVPPDPRAVVLLLHGGGRRAGRSSVSQANLSVLRMLPVAARVAGRGRGALAVLRVLNSARGWAGPPTPEDDTRWALERVRQRFGPDVPVGLVGYSLGGRAAIAAADHPQVRAVVALAPWVYPTEGRVDRTGRSILVVHGDADRVASLERAQRVAADLARTAQVGFVTVRGAGHALVRRGRVFDACAAEFTAAVLLGTPATGPVARVLDGERWLEV